MVEVSIIIPVYNRAHYIAKTLDSIIDQTFKNWECIVVDDGSTDHTLEVVKFYENKDNRIKLYQRPEQFKKGANACRNFGFSISKGQYIQWFDSDDLMFKDLLKAKTHYLNTNKSSQFCLCQMIFFEEINGQFKQQQTTNIKYKDLLLDYVSGKITIGTQTVFWRKSFLENKQLFDQDLTQSQDLEFNSRMFQNNPKGGFIDQPLIWYRQAEDSISSNYLNVIENHYQSFLEVRRRIINSNPKNLAINAAVIKSVLTLLRSSLAAKKYQISKDVIKFIKANNKNRSLIFNMKLQRIYFAYNVVKTLKFGETRLKPLFRL
ncbi:glycosyltransferase family 2 protein [Mesoflavibacter profundi]|uniref:glycosyltransferase family 2 protein n=1 Tax=Mesoflavibacter profundi TaxID=2708110 RepID=UPI00168AA3B0|nr:glycosyltransferase [Mesoflavibacter profundi]